MINIKPPRIPHKVIQTLTDSQIKDLMLLTSFTYMASVRNRAMLLMFLDTAIRLEEMSKLQLSDLDFDHETVSIKGKGGRNRHVRMGKAVQKALLKYLLMRNDNLSSLWITQQEISLTRGGIDHRHLISYL